MAQRSTALTAKEKDTLRLILRGHDAKSIARHLDLSIHTVNERLRDARRKLGVSSSREAARLLFDEEGPTPESVGDEKMGEAGWTPAVAPHPAASRAASRSTWAIAGVIVVSALLALITLFTTPQFEPTQGAPPSPGSAPTVARTQQADVEEAARRWLAIVDRGDWRTSWQETGAAFRKLNTVSTWTAASEKARAPLGEVRSRTLLTHDTMPAPPHGYDILRFRTEFVGKGAAVETVTLEREGPERKVVGYLID